METDNDHTVNIASEEDNQFVVSTNNSVEQDHVPNESNVEGLEPKDSKERNKHCSRGEHLDSISAPNEKHNVAPRQKKRDFAQFISDDFDNMSSVINRENPLSLLAAQLKKFKISDEESIGSIHSMVNVDQMDSGATADVYAFLMAEKLWNKECSLSEQHQRTQAAGVICETLLKLHDVDAQTEEQCISSNISVTNSFWFAFYLDTSFREWRNMVKKYDSNEMTDDVVDSVIHIFLHSLMGNYFFRLPHTPSSFLSFAMRKFLCDRPSILSKKDIMEEDCVNCFKWDILREMIRLNDIGSLFDRIPFARRDVRRYLMLPITTLRKLVQHALTPATDILSRRRDGMDIKTAVELTEMMICDGLLDVIQVLLHNIKAIMTDDEKYNRLRSEVKGDIERSRTVLRSEFPQSNVHKRLRMQTLVTSFTPNFGEQENSSNMLKAMIDNEVRNSFLCPEENDTAPDPNHNSLRSSNLHLSSECGGASAPMLEANSAVGNQSGDPFQYSMNNKDESIHSPSVSVSPMNMNRRDLLQYRRQQTPMRLRPPRFSKTGHKPSYGRRFNVQPDSYEIVDANSICPLKDFATSEKKFLHVANSYYMPFDGDVAKWNPKWRMNHKTDSQFRWNCFMHTWEYTKQYNIPEIRWVRQFGLRLEKNLFQRDKNKAAAILHAMWNRSIVGFQTRSQNFEADLHTKGLRVIYIGDEFICHSGQFLTSMGLKDTSVKSITINGKKISQNRRTWRGKNCCAPDQIRMLMKYGFIEIVATALSEVFGFPVFFDPKYKDQGEDYLKFNLKYLGCPRQHAYVSHSTCCWEALPNNSIHTGSATAKKIYQTKVERAAKDKVLGLNLPPDEKEKKIYAKYGITMRDAKTSYPELAMMANVAKSALNKGKITEPENIDIETLCSLLHFPLDQCWWPKSMGLAFSCRTERERIWRTPMIPHTHYKQYETKLDTKVMNTTKQCLMQWIDNMKDPENPTQVSWQRAQLFFSKRTEKTQYPPDSILGTYNTVESDTLREEFIVHDCRHIQYIGEAPGSSKALSRGEAAMLLEEFRLEHFAEWAEDMVTELGAKWDPTKYLPPFKDSEPDAELEWCAFKNRATELSTAHVLRPDAYVPDSAPLYARHVDCSARDGKELLSIIRENCIASIDNEDDATAKWMQHRNHLLSVIKNDELRRLHFMLRIGHGQDTLESYAQCTIDNVLKHIDFAKPSPTRINLVKDCIYTGIGFGGNEPIDPDILSANASMKPLGVWHIRDDANNHTPFAFVLVNLDVKSDMNQRMEEEKASQVEHPTNDGNTNERSSNIVDAEHIPILLNMGTEKLRKANKGAWRIIITQLMYEMCNSDRHISATPDVISALGCYYRINLTPHRKEGLSDAINPPQAVIFRAKTRINIPLFDRRKSTALYESAMFNRYLRVAHDGICASGIERLSTSWFADAFGTNVFGSAVSHDMHRLTPLIETLETANVDDGTIISDAKGYFQSWTENVPLLTDFCVRKGVWVDTSVERDGREYDAFIYPDEMDVVEPTMQNLPGTKYTQRNMTLRTVSAFDSWNRDKRPGIWNEESLCKSLDCNMEQSMLRSSLYPFREEFQFSCFSLISSEHRHQQYYQLAKLAELDISSFEPNVNWQDNIPQFDDDLSDPKTSSSQKREMSDNECEESEKEEKAIAPKPKRRRRSSMRLESEKRKTALRKKTREQMRVDTIMDMDIWRVFLIFLGRAPYSAMMQMIMYIILSPRNHVRTLRDLIRILSISPQREENLYWGGCRVIFGSEIISKPWFERLHLARILSADIGDFLLKIINKDDRVSMLQKDFVTVEKDWLQTFGFPTNEVKALLTNSIQNRKKDVYLSEDDSIMSASEHTEDEEQSTSSDAAESVGDAGIKERNHAKDDYVEQVAPNRVKKRNIDMLGAEAISGKRQCIRSNHDDGGDFDNETDDEETVDECIGKMYNLPTIIQRHLKDNVDCNQMLTHWEHYRLVKEWLETCPDVKLLDDDRIMVSKKESLDDIRLTNPPPRTVIETKLCIYMLNLEDDIRSEMMGVFKVLLYVVKSRRDIDGDDILWNHPLSE